MGSPLFCFVFWVYANLSVTRLAPWRMREKSTWLPRILLLISLSNLWNNLYDTLVAPLHPFLGTGKGPLLIRPRILPHSWFYVPPNHGKRAEDHSKSCIWGHLCCHFWVAFSIYHFSWGSNQWKTVGLAVTPFSMTSAGFRFNNSDGTPLKCFVATRAQEITLHLIAIAVINSYGDLRPVLY